MLLLLLAAGVCLCSDCCTQGNYNADIVGYRIMRKTATSSTATPFAGVKHVGTAAMSASLSNGNFKLTFVDGGGTNTFTTANIIYTANGAALTTLINAINGVSGVVATSTGTAGGGFTYTITFPESMGAVTTTFATVDLVGGTPGCTIATTTIGQVPATYSTVAAPAMTEGSDLLAGVFTQTVSSAYLNAGGASAVSAGTVVEFHTTAGLTAGTYYYFQIQAYNTFGRSAWSSTSYALLTPSVPDTMVAPTVSSFTGTTATLAWAAPDLQGTSNCVTVADRFKAIAEIQTITVGGSPTGGVFYVTFSGQTTASLAHNANAAAMKAALEALTNVGTVTVVLSSGVYTVTFDGTTNKGNVAAVTCDKSTLTGGTPTCAVATTTAGNDSYDDAAAKLVACTTAGPDAETQTVTVAGSPTGGTFKLSFNGVATDALAHNVAASVVKTKLEALAGVGTVTVTLAGGVYTIKFGATNKGEQPKITCDKASLTGGTPTCVVATTVKGSGSIITSYTIHKSTSSGSGYAAITDPTTGLAATVGNVLTYQVTGLTAATTYYFKVLAVNAVGSSTASPYVMRKMGAKPMTALPVTASSVTANSIALKWQTSNWKNKAYGTTDVFDNGVTLSGYRLFVSSKTWGPAAGNAGNCANTFTCEYEWASSWAAGARSSLTKDYDSSVPEIQTITLDHTAAVTAGTFTVTYAGQTTANIAFNANAAAVKAALEALSTVGIVTVAYAAGRNAGSVWTVTFDQKTNSGDLAGMTLGAKSLTPSGATVTFAEKQAGVSDVWFANDRKTGANPTLAGVTDGTWLEVRTPTAAPGATGTITVPSLSQFTKYKFKIAFTNAVGDAVVSDDSAEYVTLEAAPTSVKMFTGAPCVYKGASGAATRFVASSAGTNVQYMWQLLGTAKEVQAVVSAAGADDLGGTFTLSYNGQTTAAIAFNAADSVVKARLEALTNVGTVTVVGPGVKDGTSKGYTHTVTFNDAGDLPAMTSGVGSLTGTTPTVTVSETTKGSRGSVIASSANFDSTGSSGARATATTKITEKQRISITATAGQTIGGKFKGSFFGVNFAETLSTDTAANIKTALELMSTIATVAVTVTTVSAAEIHVDVEFTTLAGAALTKFVSSESPGGLPLMTAVTGTTTALTGTGVAISVTRMRQGSKATYIDRAQFANCKTLDCSVMEYTFADTGAPNLAVTAYNTGGMVTAKTSLDVKYCGCTDPFDTNYWDDADYHVPTLCTDKTQWTGADKTVLAGKSEHYQFYYDDNTHSAKITLRVDTGSVALYVSSTGVPIPAMATSYFSSTSAITTYKVLTIPFASLAGSRTLYVAVVGTATSPFSRYAIMAHESAFHTGQRSILADDTATAATTLTTHHYDWYEYYFPEATNDLDVEVTVACTTGDVAMYSSKTERYPSAHRASTNEVQTVTVGAGADDLGGTFTLTFASVATGNIAFGASASTVQTALNAISTVTGATVTRGSKTGNGYVWTITFDGVVNTGDLAITSCAAGSLTGTSATCVVAEATKGVAGYWKTVGSVAAGVSTTTVHSLRPEDSKPVAAAGALTTNPNALYIGVRGIKAYTQGSSSDVGPGVPGATASAASNVYTIKAKVFRYEISSDLLDPVVSGTAERRYSVVKQGNMNYYQVKLSSSAYTVTATCVLHFGSVELYSSKTKLPTRDTSVGFDTSQTTAITTPGTGTLTINYGNINIANSYVYVGVYGVGTDSSYTFSVAETKFTQSVVDLDAGVEKAVTLAAGYNFFQVYVGPRDQNMETQYRAAAGTRTTNLGTDPAAWGIDWTESLTTSWIQNNQDDHDLDVDVTLSGALKGLQVFGSSRELYPSTERGYDVTKATFDGTTSGFSVPHFTFSDKLVYIAVKAAGSNVAEVQSVTTVNSATISGGTFKLAYNGKETAAIAYDAANSVVKSALEALSTVSTVSVSGPSVVSNGKKWVITFDGTTNGGNLDAITCVSSLTASSGTPTCASAEDTAGVAGATAVIRMKATATEMAVSAVTADVATTTGWSTCPGYTSGSNVCTQHGSCIIDDSVATCECDQGWQGKDCSVEAFKSAGYVALTTAGAETFAAGKAAAVGFTVTGMPSNSKIKVYVDGKAYPSDGGNTMYYATTCRDGSTCASPNIVTVDTATGGTTMTIASGAKTLTFGGAVFTAGQFTFGDTVRFSGLATAADNAKTYTVAQACSTTVLTVTEAITSESTKSSGVVTIFPSSTTGVCTDLSACALASGSSSVSIYDQTPGIAHTVQLVAVSNDGVVLDMASKSATLKHYGGCDGGCSNQGICHHGYCVCFDGYAGTNCATDIWDSSNKVESSSSITSLVSGGFKAGAAYAAMKKNEVRMKLDEAAYLNKAHNTSTMAQVAAVTASLLTKKAAIQTTLNNFATTNANAITSKKATLTTTAEALHRKRDQLSTKQQQIQEEAVRLQTTNKETYRSEERTLLAYQTTMQNTLDTKRRDVHKANALKQDKLNEVFKESAFILNQLKTANGPRVAISELETEECTTDQFYHTTCSKRTATSDFTKKAGYKSDQLLSAQSGGTTASSASETVTGQYQSNLYDSIPR